MTSDRSGTVWAGTVWASPAACAARAGRATTKREPPRLLGFPPHPSAVEGDEGAHEEQPDTGARGGGQRAATDVRLEHRLGHVGGEPGTVVVDPQERLPHGRPDGLISSASDRPADFDASGVGGVLDGVRDEVVEDPLEQGGVGPHPRVLGDAAADLLGGVSGSSEHDLDDVVQVDVGGVVRRCRPPTGAVTR